MTIQALRTVQMYDPFIPVAFTAPPALFEPPAALTDGRHEVWAAAGGPTGWGGCHVWGSMDDASYDYVGTIASAASVGVLAAPLPASADPDTTNTLEVDVSSTRGVIHPGSDQSADTFATLCWIGGELVAHTAATLVGPHHYKMHRRLRRGALGTSVSAHARGTTFARLDFSVFRLSYPRHLAGATVHVKFPAYNEFGTLQQTLDEVPSYTVTLTGVSGK